MTLRLIDKQKIVSDINDVGQRATALVASHYSGLPVSKLEELRIKAKQSGVYLKVVRNTLARRALEGTSFGCVTADLKGPIVLAFSFEEPGAAAKVVANFQKENEQLVAQAIAVDGELIPVSELKSVAALPTRDEALSMLAGTMLAPVTGVARTANEVVASLARALNAVAEKEQAA